MDRKFHSFKVSTSGTQTRWGYVTNLTLEETKDEKRFPLGVHEDDCGKYFWSFAIMPEYVM